MAASDAALEVETVAHDAVPLRVRAFGEWTFSGLKARRAEILRDLAELERQPAERVAWDLTRIADLDDAGALWLARAVRGAPQVEVSALHREMLDQVREGLRVPGAAGPRADLLLPLVAIGEAALRIAVQLRDATALLGHLVLDAVALLRRPRDVPLRELSAGVYRAGVTALPVTMLVGFLVGIVLTYLSALQLKRYGADLLVINIVGVGVVRELGPMLASIIAAGRSGSAITAQLGVMRVTEEIEALSVMGVSVITRLVLPKVIALSIALPLVAFCTDLAALGGAMLVSRFTLGIAPASAARSVQNETSGSATASAITLGSTRRVVTDTPITDSASISSVTRITPSCAVIAEPERPAAMIDASMGPSSRTTPTPTMLITSRSAP